MILVDASRKKAGFLEIAVRELALSNVEVVCARAEALGRAPAHRDGYDVVTARALADLRVLAEYALPLLRLGGVGIFPKGRAALGELAAAARALDLLGGTGDAASPVAGWCSNGDRGPKRCRPRRTAILDEQVSRGATRCSADVRAISPSLFLGAAVSRR